MKTSKILLTAVTLMALNLGQASAFCGFYVAKADATLFNNKSQVIMVRDGYRSVITMANDFKGDVKDFAMVVPVPVVLQREDIRIVQNSLFSQLDGYSAPRLVEYHDENPCAPVYRVRANMNAQMEMAPMLTSPVDLRKAKDMGVTIEAQYNVGEYDILILSAKESTGLKTWLIQSGYKIPESAHKVLDPYIKNGLKFFVVKVDMEAMKQQRQKFLRPIQIAFKSERFMLPIRLGMANSAGEQDMIVYAFTKQGRVECTNYRTVEIPSNRNIPVSIKPNFNNFYKDLFKNAYEREGKNAVFLEYAWDVTPVNPVKCDPCVGNPPQLINLQQAGVDWATPGARGNKVYFTRLHVRYSRDKFPQDLFFQVTPNQQRYQGRYVMTHPAKGDFSCDAGQTYLQNLEWRRKKEVDELASLTGWNASDYRSYIKEYDRYIRPDALKKDRKKGSILFLPSSPKGPSGWLMLLAFVSLIGISGLQWYSKRKRMPLPSI